MVFCRSGAFGLDRSNPDPGLATEPEIGWPRHADRDAAWRLVGAWIGPLAWFLRQRIQFHHVVSTGDAGTDDGGRPLAGVPLSVRFHNARHHGAGTGPCHLLALLCGGNRAGPAVLDRQAI